DLRYSGHGLECRSGSLCDGRPREEKQADQAHVDSECGEFRSPDSSMLITGCYYLVSGGQRNGLVSMRSCWSFKWESPETSPDLPLEARKEDLAYDPSAGKTPVASRPACGADRMDP